MDEIFVGAIVDTPDGIGEVVDVSDDEDGYVTVRLERTGEEIEYDMVECDLLDEPTDDDLEFDGDALDDEYEGDEDEFRSEFDEEDEE